MTQINPTLLQLANQRASRDRSTLIEKVAVVPPGGGAPPMDPMAGGAPPPMDPAMAGGMPPGAPPMDPAMGGAPPMDPAMAGGMPPGAPPPMDPSMGMGMMPGAVPPKLKPEQMMQMLDFRLYNMQQQLTALMNALDIQLPPGALVTPPGSPTPVAEAAVPGGPQDPGPAAAGGGQSAIAPIDPIQGASPELAGGGAEKIGNDQSFSALVDDLSKRPLSKAAEFSHMLAASNPTVEIMRQQRPAVNAAAISRMLAQRAT